MADYKSSHTGTQIDNAVDQAHTHENKILLDTYNQTNENLSDAVNKKHEHTNKVVLDNTTASYTEEEKSKLSGLSNYVLTPATQTTLGGIKVGNNLTIEEDGTLNATGGSSGTTEYSLLTNKPQINSIELNGNKTSSDLGLVSSETGKGLSTNDYTDTEKQNNASNTSARHTHSNKDLLDTYTQTNSDISGAVSMKHEHTNKTILDNVTASYTTTEKTKLAGIETGAQVNTVNSVNNKTGAVILSANDVGAMPASTIVTAFWKGTQVEYDALGTYGPNTLYLITE